MKKTILISAIILTSFLISVSASAGVNTTISLDGEMDDWADVPKLLENEETWYPFEGTTYYWNNDTDAWQTDELTNACMYNETRSLDLSTIKFANDSDYLYFYWEKNSDYMNYFWFSFPETDNTSVEEASFTADPVAVEEAPCLGEQIYNPIDYDHDKVFEFDVDLDGVFDYYLVMNVVAPMGTAGTEYSYTVTSYVYQDDDNGQYDGRATETLVSELGSDYAQFPSSFACENGVCQEGRIKINTFFTDLGLAWGDVVFVRYEAFSDHIFKTSKALYSFNKNNKLKLKITSPKNNAEVSKKKINLKVSVKKGVTLTIYVNGDKRDTFAMEENKISYQLTLDKGTNIIKVKAKKGGKTVVKAIKVIKN